MKRLRMAVHMATLMSLTCLLACPAAPPRTLGAKSVRCDDAASCERAIAEADAKVLPGLLESYAATTGNRAWIVLYDGLRKTREVPFVGAGGATAGTTELALPPATTEVPRAALVLALARATGHAHVLLLESGEGRQLFALDALAPHMLGLSPIVSLDPGAASASLRIANLTRSALRSAGEFDYVAAAAATTQLPALIATVGDGDEGALRARFALWLLDSAGIALAGPTLAAPDVPAELSSPYAELLAVQLARPEHTEAWSKRGPRIIGGMSAARVRALSRVYAPEETCPAPLAPPIEHASDIAFAALLALALDENAAPDEPAATGKLGMTAWLERYNKLVQLVDGSGSTWAALGSLLRQRGEIFGLTAEGTGAYRRVSDLALAHIAALTKLAEAEPTRFQPLGVVSLVYQPGVLSDVRLRPAITTLLSRSVALKIAHATDAGALFDAALAAFAAGMSYPAELQATQFAAIEQALQAKLSSPFGRQESWRMAGLHLGAATLAALLDGEGALLRGVERMAASLGGDVSHPALARLAIGAASYAKLSGDGQRHATVSNPAMFSGARRQARSDLRRAIEELAAPGPTKAPQKQLHQELTELLDALIVTATAYAQSPRSGPQCASDGAIAASSPLRGAIQRLRKKRKRLLESHAFDRGDATWTRRARLVALLSSDLLDFLDRSGGAPKFSISSDRARKIVDQALAGWMPEAGAELAAGSYLLVRSSFDLDGGTVAMESIVRALSAIGKLFVADDNSILATLATLGANAGSAGAKDVGSLITAYARRAYATRAADHGDLLLMIRLAVAVARGRDVDQASVDLADAHGRAIYLPLLMYGPKTSRNSSRLEHAMRQASQRGCNAPNPGAVLAVKSAIASFKAGRRDGAIRTLGTLLDAAEADGLVIPRLVFRFEQHDKKKVFNAEQSVSFGQGLLRGVSAFQLGLGFQSRERSQGSMKSEFADPQSARSAEEAARYFAHAAALQASYAFLTGRDHDAIRAARRAIGVWIHGARLGKARVLAGGKSARWARDATATLVVLGQQATDAGQVFLAGDLWTLAKATLDSSIDDAGIASILHPLPDALSGIDALAAVVARADKNLTILGMSLPCTQKNGAVADLVRVRCEGYATALALRATDSLAVLPRINKAPSQAPTCAAWRKLDHFLAASDLGRYQPKRLIAAVFALNASGRAHDAASLLTRHRHPGHCNPQLVDLARKLANHEELGKHLRADLLTIATNCAAPDDVTEDLLALDELTQRHATITRNFETLLFATRLALKHNVWQPLAQMSARRGFIQRFNELGPDFGTAALLVHHAAAVGVGDSRDREATLPFYRLLCTTFPPKERSAMCHAISVLVGPGAAADKKRTAAKALASFLQRGAQAMRKR